ncbi:hypothetical protein LOZ61_000039 [Ophidiomyces ophidiicola]|nr:hypothetical protein LOZ61_000039 [Ophidiomyces ophidiicola]KAI1926491.1 hypothetical protein LOZ64_000257 [Ophidiomyces ophidiicola]KAI1931611.1 hypothetical protein LOZ60_000143 [Ophidiomyces ophidiicola]KAI1969055.1 hypothetical protein LOZ59_000081 [Ophidiomyces ophidiicola]KAI2014947.1 hypothetical protein LOZ49_001035 [Ophidiomyces ophidiicola]
MLSSTRSSLRLLTARSSRFIPRATYTSTAPRLSEKSDNGVPTTHKKVTSTPESHTVPSDSIERADKAVQMQAPNREVTWAKSQQPREAAMSGPRFEQTTMEYQPRPYAAIELIHRQPVRWTKERVVSCDGGGGPLGHPKIFINTDKPEIAVCGYCGLPFANEHNRKFLESLPQTSYPLEPVGHPAEVPESQRVTDGAFEQR